MIKFCLKPRLNCIDVLGLGFVAEGLETFQWEFFLAAFFLLMLSSIGESIYHG